MGRFLPPDYGAGDESTVGGYAAVHSRPPALEGADGFAYSVEASAQPTGHADEPWGGYLLFLRWRRMGAQGVEGHLETDFLVRGQLEDEVLAAVRAISLEEAGRYLGELVAARQAAEGTGTRRWWDVMKDDDGA